MCSCVNLPGHFSSTSTVFEIKSLAGAAALVEEPVISTVCLSLSDPALWLLESELRPSCLRGKCFRD